MCTQQQCLVLCLTLDLWVTNSFGPRRALINRAGHTERMGCDVLCYIEAQKRAIEEMVRNTASFPWSVSWNHPPSSDASHLTLFCNPAWAITAEYRKQQESNHFTSFFLTEEWSRCKCNSYLISLSFIRLGTMTVDVDIPVFFSCSVASQVQGHTDPSGHCLPWRATSARKFPGKLHHQSSPMVCCPTTGYH